MSDLNFKLINQGDLDKDIIVFIHGFSLNQRIWKPQIDFFKNDFRILIYDMRGFGSSPMPEDNYAHHNDLLDLLKYLNISKLNLVGMSLGGEVALDFVLEYPNLVDSLTLINSSLGGYKSNVNQVDWTVEGQVASWQQKDIFNYPNISAETKKLINKIISDYSGWHWENKDFRKKLSPSALDRLHEIEIPVKILVGKQDLEYFKEIARLLNKEVSKTELIEVNKAGHFANLDRPSIVNREIQNHILACMV